jgi:hypothetical protein
MPTKQVKKTGSNSSKSGAKHDRPSMLLVASLVVNIVVIVIIASSIVIWRSGMMNFAIANAGMDAYCNSQIFRDNVAGSSKDSTESKRRVALIDFSCARNGADTYFVEGFNNYLKSLGIPADKTTN